MHNPSHSNRKDVESKGSEKRGRRDHRFPDHEVITILPGECFVSSSPVVIATLLGSCVSVCMRDPSTGVGGMNHFMLPEPGSVESGGLWSNKSRFGCYAMEKLINAIMSRGGSKSRLELKVFGGAKLYEGSSDIGASNVKWIVEFVDREGLQVVASDVGRDVPRHIFYYTDSGRVLMKPGNAMDRKRVVAAEKVYTTLYGPYGPKSVATLF
jgi:chemotaxis protein CheD